MDKSERDVSALVVGAGPTGLTMAAELARREVAFRLVEKAPEPSPLSRALGVHARTLEVFEDLGVAAALIARGVRVRGVNIVAKGEVLVHASLEELDTHYPFMLCVPQSETEAVLAARVADLGGVVERGVEVVRFTQDETGVDATLRHADGREEAVRSRWIVGCDGAHSVVRKGLGLDFVGERYDERFLLADVTVDNWTHADDHITSFFAEAGLLACFPLGERRWRMIATAPLPTSDGGDLGDDAPTIEQMHAIVDERAGVGAALRDATWLAAFRIHCRQVTDYRQGQGFLCGDAAHIHSPVGGQGMNTGIQDAHNLAWKLGLVDAGVAPRDLLDSYHEERHRLGANLLRGTDFATRVATLRNPVARAVRNHVASFLSSVEIVQQRMASNVAELTLNYRGSPIVSEDNAGLLSARIGSAESAEEPNLRAWRQFGLAPSAGDRLPDAEVTNAAGARVRLATIIDGRRHTLLLFDGRASTGEGYEHLAGIARAVTARYGRYVDVHLVTPRPTRPDDLRWDGSLLHDTEGDLERRFGAVAECLYLIRPDLYIGYRSQPADGDGLFAHLEAVFLPA